MSKKKTIHIPQLNQAASLIDSHCHLTMPCYKDDLNQILLTAYEHGIHTIISIGTDIQSSYDCIQLAKAKDMIYATIGIHPDDSTNFGKEEIASLKQMLSEREENKIVAIGEIGLDYFDNEIASSVQKIAFMAQLELAREYQLPVVIHNRDAHNDTLEILHACGPFEASGIMHCFSGDIQYMKKILDLGFYISIPGIITFKNAGLLKEVARTVPLDRLLIETDGPFLTPAPYRGKRNQPFYVIYTAEEIAKLRTMDLSILATATTSNAKRLFALP